TGPSGLQGSLHHGSGLAQDGVRPALAERGPGGVEAGAGGPQRLVGGGVADAADQVLGQQQGLDGGAAGAQAAGDRRQIGSGGEHVARDLRGIGGDQRIGAAGPGGRGISARDQLGGPDPSEQSLVDQIDRATVVQVQGQAPVAQRIGGRAL